jgi:hypothetical protein
MALAKTIAGEEILSIENVDGTEVVVLDEGLVLFLMPDGAR